MIARALLAGAALLLFAPVAFAHDDPPPVFDLKDRQCASTPDLTTARPLAFDGKRSKSHDAVFDTATACLVTDNGPVLYQMFKLPASAVPYTVSVASEPVDGTLFVPHLQLLDESGAKKREYTGDDAMFRGEGMAIIFRAHADETYLLLASEPTHANKQISRVQETTHTYAAAAGTAVFMIYTGDDTTRTLIYTHSGEIEITFDPLPQPKPKT